MADVVRSVVSFAMSAHADRGASTGSITFLAGMLVVICVVVDDDDAVGSLSRMVSSGCAVMVDRDDTSVCVTVWVLFLLLLLLMVDTPRMDRRAIMVGLWRYSGASGLRIENCDGIVCGLLCLLR